MYTMSNMAKQNIERVIGLSLDKIKAMSIDEEQKWVERRRRERLIFSKKRRKGIIGRGNPLLARRKIRTMEDLDKKSKKYIGI